MWSPPLSPAGRRCVCSWPVEARPGLTHLESSLTPSPVMPHPVPGALLCAEEMEALWYGWEVPLCLRGRAGSVSPDGGSGPHPASLSCLEPPLHPVALWP